ncbi:MAG: AI-2E family transporter [Pseudomonadota bacterium]
MDQHPRPIDQTFSRNAMDAAVKIGLVAFVVYWCFEILAPFIIVVFWAAILAIGFHPLCQRIARRLGGRTVLAATLLTLFSVVLLVGPIGSLGLVFVEDMNKAVTALQSGAKIVPPPPQGVKEWPLVGETLHEFWDLAAHNLTAAVKAIRPQLTAVAQTVLSSAANISLGLLQFLVALIIAGFLLTRSKVTDVAMVAVAERLMAERGEPMVRLMESTVRNVTRGVLGTAVIQTFFIGLGMVVAGIPGAAIWTALCLFLSIVQIGPGIVMVGTVLYMFSEASTLAAVVYLIYAVPVTLIDNVLKPILMGRGSTVPVLVIFLGVVGGTLAYGLIGVFVGPVVLAVGYVLFMAWLETSKESPPAP